MSFFLTTPNMIKLGINVDHIATLRNAHGTLYPDPIQAALTAEEAGADVIILHLHEDYRHIIDADVRTLRSQLKTRMNLRCAIMPEMLCIASEIKPHDVCFVSGRRQGLTTKAGLDVANEFEVVRNACCQLADLDIRVSLFIDPDETQILAAHEIGVRVIELHTGYYAKAHDASNERQREYERIMDCVEFSISRGLVVHVGYGLDYSNVQQIAAINDIAELNIGYAIVAHALFVGWSNAVREMKAIIVAARA